MSWAGHSFNDRRLSQQTDELGSETGERPGVQSTSPRHSCLRSECSSAAGHCSIAVASNRPGLTTPVRLRGSSSQQNMTTMGAEGGGRSPRHERECRPALVSALVGLSVEGGAAFCTGGVGTQSAVRARRSAAILWASQPDMYGIIGDARGGGRQGQFLHLNYVPLPADADFEPS